MSLQPFLQKVPWKVFAFFLTCTLVITSRSTAQVPRQPSQTDKQELRITGTIKNALGNALSGTTVKELVTGKSALTNAEGVYSIMARQGDSLSFSYVGYNRQSIVITDRIVFDITLDAVSGSLNDVVVVGYGQQKKISLVGAQSTVSIDDLKEPVANLSAALAGRISGLVGVQRTGLPGSNGADLWIRGIATFNGSGNDASPLVIVDGVQGRDLNSFDPEDLASFTILKDASATAVYGAAGANGVILIQTKKGRAGKPVLMFNYNEGINTFTKLPKLTNAQQYMTLRNEAEVNSGLPPDYSQAYIDSTITKRQPYLYPNVDWEKAIFNSVADSRRANFSARGGSENANYYVSVAYYDEKSLMKTDNLASYNADTRFRRYNFTSNIDMNWTKTTKFELGIQGYISNVNYPGVPAATNGGSSAPQQIFADVMQTNPVLYPIMYPGDVSPGISNQGAQPNPYVELTQTGFQNIFTSQLYSNARLSQDFSPLVKGLSFYVMYAFDDNNSQTTSQTRARSLYFINQTSPYNPDGTLNLNLIYNGSDNPNFANANGGSKQFYLESAFNYDRQFGSKSHVTGLILFNQKNYTNAFPTDITSSLPYKSEGLAGRATYSWSDRYFGEFNFGYNGSENFAPQNRFGFFPSMGVGWVVSNEKFYQPVKEAIQFLKFRYSNGVVGDGGVSQTSGTRRFGYLTLVSNSSAINGYTFGNGVNNTSYGGLAITDYGTDVKWARSHKQDAGIEIKTLQSKLSLTVDYFNEYRSGVFLQRASLADYAGFVNNPYANLGIITNRGFDGTLELAPFPVGNTHWALRGVYSFNRDKVIQNDQPVQPYPYMEQRGTNYLSTFGYVATGLFQSQEEIDNAPSQSALSGSPLHPGDIRYKDLNGDGKIDANDEKRIGNGDVPNITYGFGINVTWKQWNMGVFFEGIHGAQRQLSGDGIFPFDNSTGAERSNLYAVAESRWTPANPSTHPFYPRLAYGQAENANNDVTSSWWEKDIDFLRLKTADFGYTLPKGTLKGLGLRTGRFYIQGLNLMYWSKFKLWDPELNTTNGSMYPNTRNVTFGFQANF